MDLNLRSLRGDFKTYGELRYQENRDIRLAMLNGDLIMNSQESVRGISARAFAGGYWGFSSHSRPTLESAKKAIEEASRNAQFLGSRQKKSAHLASGKSLNFEKSFASRQPKQSMAFWIDLMKGIDARIKSKYPDLKARMVRLMALDMEKQFFTSEGAEAHTLVPRAHLMVSMTKDSDNGPVSHYDVTGGLGQLEDRFQSSPETWNDWLEALYQQVSEKAKGVIPESGTHDVILNSDLAGILAHEAVGHTVESDIVLGGSVAKDYLGKPVASSLVNLVDFAHTARGEICPQPIFVDDEGTEAQDTVIIENGILKTFMNNKETAAHFSQTATGHARAFKFSDEPLIRMRNTAILPGKSKLDEMIASIDKGYYLMNPANGQADTTGEFMFGVGFGYEIKNGKLGRPLRDTTISGVAFEMLKSVTMISDEFEWESSGYCGKKQPMPVGMGGPSIKSRLHIGGQ